jgi:hypothetical protein
MTIEDRPLFVTVSGSFKRHLANIQEAVGALTEIGAVVLSPADPRIVDSFGDFVFVSSDRRRSIKGVQNRHLEAIRRSDFLWLACPDGYVGQSAAMEVGFAVGAGIPIYSDAPPLDWTLRQYTRPVGTVLSAAAAARRDESADLAPDESLLISPSTALAAVRRNLDVIEKELSNPSGRVDEPIEAPIGKIHSILSVPTGPRR